jgi:GT2 family glycosyltransferase
MKLAVGFITYNDSSAKYLADFVPSILLALQFLGKDNYQIYAWDNSAPENKVNKEALSLYPELEYLSTGENLGFGRAYNIMINRAKQLGAEYFLIINPDTILEPPSLQAMVRALDSDVSLASVAPKILRWNFAANTKTKQIDSAGIILKPGLRFHDLGQGQEDEKQFDRRSILGPSGAAGLFRLSALEKIQVAGQYFDERFFMYKEDCDLDYRLQQSGFTSRLVPESIIYHDRTAYSTGTSLGSIFINRFRKSRQIRLWSHLNEHLIYVKHWSSQNFVSRLFIIIRFVTILLFSLILEQFLLKNYVLLWRASRVLTNVK